MKKFTESFNLLSEDLQVEFISNLIINDTISPAISLILNELAENGADKKLLINALIESIDNKTSSITGNSKKYMYFLNKCACSFFLSKDFASSLNASHIPKLLKIFTKELNGFECCDDDSFLDFKNILINTNKINSLNFFKNLDYLFDKEGKSLFISALNELIDNYDYLINDGIENDTAGINNNNNNTPKLMDTAKIHLTKIKVLIETSHLAKKENKKNLKI